MVVDKAQQIEDLKRVGTCIFMLLKYSFFAFFNKQKGLKSKI